MKVMLLRIVAVPTRMAMKFDGVAVSCVEYHTDVSHVDE